MSDTATVSKSAAIREAVEAKGRSKFSPQDIAEATGVPTQDIYSVLSREVNAGRLVHPETGVYQATRAKSRAYEPRSNGNGNGESNGNGNGTAQPADPARATTERFTVVARLTEGTLLRDGEGELWLARRATLTTE